MASCLPRPVDVTFRHGQLPPAVHSAGLVRDLGRTAAADRGLHFHFE